MESHLLPLLIALSIRFCTGRANEQSVYFSLVVSSAPTINTSGIISDVDRVLELINSNATFLPGYRLQYTQVLDTQCDNRSRVLSLLREITSNDSAIVGCGCSLATEEIASRIDIPVISYASTSVALSDRIMYPNVFRTVPSDESLAPALATVMQYYGWRTLSILTEQETQFTKFLQFLDIALLAASISIENSVHFHSGNLSEAADTVFEGESRIILLNTNPKSALFHLCKAFLEGRYYPGYVWITPGWYQQGWWKADENYLHSLNCTTSDIEQQLTQSLVLLAHPNTNSENITKSYNSSPYAMYTVITLALALNKILENPSLNLSLLSAIEAIMFNGASGIVLFDSSGNRLNPVVFLQQFRVHSHGSTTLSTIARIINTTVMYINGETRSTIWPDTTGTPPIITAIRVIKTPVYAYVLTLVTIGLILSVASLLFNIIFRNRRIVKLTSPNLSYAIILGVILLLIGNLFTTNFQSQNKEFVTILCIIQRIFQAIGYDICFVVALVKTARVVYIFKKVSPTKRNVKDWHLLLLSIGIVMIEVVYVIPLLMVNYVKGKTRFEVSYKNPSFINEHGYTVVDYNSSCDRSLTYIIFFSLSITYKVIIHLIGLVLAFLIRKVEIDSLNDSKYSTAIIYCSCLILISVTAINFTVSGINNVAIVWSTFVFIEVCMFLGLTFIPKMVLLYKDPQGKSIFNDNATKFSRNASTNYAGDQLKGIRTPENSIQDDMPCDL